MSEPSNGICFCILKKNSMSKNPTPQLSNTQRTHQQTPEDKTTTIQLRTQMVLTFWKSSLTQNHQKNGRIHPNRWGLEVVQVQLFSTEVPANWITSPICHPRCYGTIATSTAKAKRGSPTNRAVWQFAMVDRFG